MSHNDVMFAAISLASHLRNTSSDIDYFLEREDYAQIAKQLSMLQRVLDSRLPAFNKEVAS